MQLQYSTVKSNGQFGLIKGPYEKKQHPNQQGGLDQYVDVINYYSGRVCSVKLYQNTLGLHFKMDGTQYLDEFTDDAIYVPFQILHDGKLEI